jgi:hypothetical protein
MKSTRKWSKTLLADMAVKASLIAVLAFGLVLTGCNDDDGGGGGGGGGVTPSVDVSLPDSSKYPPSGTWIGEGEGQGFY